MCRCSLESKTIKLDVNLTPSANFVACLLPALIAALPTFINSLLSCVASGGTAGDYHPGDRVRCS